MQSKRPSSRCQKKKKKAHFRLSYDTGYSDVFKDTILRQACEKMSFLSVLFHSETLFPDHCDMKEHVFTERYRVPLKERS